MTRSKKVFLGFMLVFAILLGYASYDIATRTTFPGSKSQLKERLKKNYLKRDSTELDSAAQKKVDLKP
jgi:hypothetical protein